MRRDDSVPLWLIAAILLALAFAGLAGGAPRPFAPKAPAGPPAIVPGGYWMLWQCDWYEVRFCPDGRFYEFYHGRWWEGRWKCEGGVLSIVEAPINEPDLVCKWQVELSSPTAGKIREYSEWRLAPLVPLPKGY